MASQERSQEALFQNDVELEHELEGGEEDELEKLGAEVNEMAHKILNYRTTLPDQLKSTLSSFLVARRPILPALFYSGSDSRPGPSNETNPDVLRPTGFGLGNEASLSGDEPETEKIKLLKQKISSNATTMPIVLKKMKDCMRRIDDLDSCNGIIIHPAFKRKKNS